MTALVNQANLPGNRKHERQGVIGNGIAVCADRAGNPDSPFPAQGQVNIVEPDAILGNGHEIFGRVQNFGIQRVNSDNHAFAGRNQLNH